MSKLTAGTQLDISLFINWFNRQSCTVAKDLFILIVNSACKLAPTIQSYIAVFVYFGVSYKPKF